MLSTYHGPGIVLSTQNALKKKKTKQTKRKKKGRKKKKNGGQEKEGTKTQTLYSGVQN